jgi:hypothetical protein
VTAHGGTRSGAGRPRGRRSGPTLKTRTKAAVEEAYRGFMLEVHRDLWLSQRERALGAYVLLVKTETGYERVTDPEAIARVVAVPQGRGSRYWLIEARGPDAALVKEINNRLMGVPTQVHEVSGSLSLAEILAGLTPKEEER